MLPGVCGESSIGEISRAVDGQPEAALFSSADCSGRIPTAGATSRRCGQRRYSYFSSISGAWAAARRATGTRKGEQLTYVKTDGDDKT